MRCHWHLKAPFIQWIFSITYTHRLHDFLYVCNSFISINKYGQFSAIMNNFCIHFKSHARQTRLKHTNTQRICTKHTWLSRVSFGIDDCRLFYIIGLIVNNGERARWKSAFVWMAETNKTCTLSKPNHKIIEVNSHKFTASNWFLCCCLVRFALRYVLWHC